MHLLAGNLVPNDDGGCSTRDNKYDPFPCASSLEHLHSGEGSPAFFSHSIVSTISLNVKRTMGS
jgi:hypothetical protein